MGNKVVDITTRNAFKTVLLQDRDWDNDKLVIEDWENFSPTQELDLAQCMRRYPDEVWNRWNRRGYYSRQKNDTVVTALQSTTFRGINLIAGDSIVFTVTFSGSLSS